MNTSARAQSRYRQLRLTVTHESSGRLSYSLYAKGLNASWNEHQCLLRETIAGTRRPLETTEDALQAILLILEDLVLPRQSHAD